MLCIACQKSESPLPPDLYQTSESIKILHDRLNGSDIILAGSPRDEWMVAFDRELNGSIRSFQALQGQLPSIMTDHRGNTYDLFGQITEGPERGHQLKTINSGVGFWFAFSSTFPGIELYRQGAPTAEYQADTTGPWSIATNVMARGASFDAIPSIDNPKTIQYIPRASIPGEEFFLSKDDLMIWVSVNGHKKAYPHKILDWHEIVNDELGGKHIAVTYSPLSGTAKVWERNAPDNLFVVSGLLYNSNMLAYAKGTGNYWQQIHHRAVNEPPNMENAELIPHLELKWEDLLRIEQNPLILSDETGFVRNYDEYPLGDYKKSDRISYPIFFQDERLNAKERVFCIVVEDEARVYQFKDLE